MNINGSYLFVKKKIVKKINIEEKIIEPIAPEIVFFGLIFVSLVPLTIYQLQNRQYLKKYKLLRLQKLKFLNANNM